MANMVVYLILGITVGMLFGILLDKYVFPYFDIVFEKFTYRVSVICTQYQVDAQNIAKEFEDASTEVQEMSSAIGFQYSDSSEIYEYDYEDKKNNL